MLKIHQIFLINFIVAYIVIFASVSFFIYQNGTSFQAKEANLDLAAIVEILSMQDSLDNYTISNLAKITKSQITIIKDSEVITTSSKILPQNLELNPDNTAIIDGNRTTFHTGFIGDKSFIVAKDIEFLYENFKATLIKVGLFFIITLTLFYAISRKFSSLIDNEIKDIEQFLDKISNKNYKATIDKSNIDEFNSIVKLLTDMRDKTKKLDDKLSKRTAKIRLKNTQLESILSSISHEFKNPISIIKAASQTLKDESLTKAERVNFTDKIVRNSEKLVELVDTLKASFGDNFEINLTKFQLNPLCEEIKKSLLDRYENREILVDGDAEILADRVMIRQVIINLVENALKYSQNLVEIKISNDTLIVKDSGVGIRVDDISLVSKKFFRVDKNSWNNSLGLGLYIVKNILKLHEFNFIIRSELGVGSEIGFGFNKPLKNQKREKFERK